MRKLFFVLMIAGLVQYCWQHGNPLAYFLNPGEIKNPLYLELRVVFEHKDRSIEGVILVETADQADCQKISDGLLQALSNRPSELKGISFSVKSKECKAELASRYKSFFSNEADLLTYVSAARGDPREREMRLIYWGVSVDESDLVCDMVPKLKASWKGPISCIRGLRS